MKKAKKKIKRGMGERIGHAVVCAVLILFSITCVYPFLHVLMYSLSDSRAAMTGGLFFYPRGFDLLAYQMIFKTKQIYVAYGNTILRTLAGTTLSIFLTALTAYPLSLKRMRGRNGISLFIFFTMLFTGGMIPTYLAVQSYGMIDTFWALIIPSCMSAYNLFILRNYFQGLPASLEESAFIDGANEITVLFKIILPISTPAIAAVAMFYGVANWNSYMDGILYTNSTSLEILQVYLRKLMASTGTMNSLAGVDGQNEAARLSEESMKMATIAVSVIPVIVVYPFLQRYYTKGITVGAVKG